MKYKTAQEWREAAMQMPQGVSDMEMAQRKQRAQVHALKEGKNLGDDDWKDYMLYIMGKMELEEYQAYLLFKHSSGGK